MVFWTLILPRFPKLFFITDFRFMFTTNRFRFFVFTSAFTVLLAAAVRAESDQPAGPQAPVFPPVEESSEAPDLSGVEDSILIDDLNDGGPALTPAAESPANDSSLKDSSPKESPLKNPSLNDSPAENPSGLETPDLTGIDPLQESLVAPSASESAPEPGKSDASENASTGKTSSDAETSGTPKDAADLDTTPYKPLKSEGSKEKKSVLDPGLSEKKEPKRLVQASPAKTDETREEISIARRLLLKLSPPDSVLDGVEQVDLRTFLNASPLSVDASRTREALPHYWKAAELRSEVFYWANRLEAMKNLAENATGTDREVYNSAAAAAQASLNLSKVTLRSNAMKLASLAGYTREVTAKTLPHAGEYDTRYDEIVKLHSENSQITLYHGLLKLHQEQLTAAASAYLTAESLLNHLSPNAPASTVLAAWDVLNERRKVFFEVLLNFNDDILNYVLTISNRRGPELAPLLVKPVSTSPNVGAAAPSLPTPPAKAPAPPADLPSVVMDQEEDPASSPYQPVTPIQPVDQGAGQVQAENSSIDLSPAGTPRISAGTVSADGNGGVTGIQAEPPIPGYDLGAPAVETAPPGSDFIPIGGETGVDTNPSLNSFPMNDGVWLLPRLRPGEQRITLGKPSIPEGAESAFIRENGISLTDVLKRSAFQNRESAVHSYWRYVMLQKQAFVLEYQRNLLEVVSRRLLASLSSRDSRSASLPPELGTILELNALTLRVALVEMKVEEWKVLNRLASQLSWKVEWPVVFPDAVTDLKTEGFMLGLDQNVSGSVMDRRALPWARHLYFAREELSDSFQSVVSLGDLIAPPDAKLEDSKLGKRLQNASSEELKAILKAMAEARNVSWNYFQLLHDVNVAYTSCVLAGTQAEKEPEELAALLAN